MPQVTIICRDCGKVWQREEAQSICDMLAKLPLRFPAREICEDCKKIRKEPPPNA
jgi:hypothetical protein